MVLIIDTIGKECLVGIYDKGSFDIKKWQWRKDTGTEVLKNIEKFLKINKSNKINRSNKTNKSNMANVQAIIVNQGPGSFTGTRVGIVVANTLGWSLGIPVIGYSGQDFQKVAKKISAKLKSGQIPRDHFPTPIY